MLGLSAPKYPIVVEHDDGAENSFAAGISNNFSVDSTGNRSSRFSLASSPITLTEFDGFLLLSRSNIFM